MFRRLFRSASNRGFIDKIHGDIVAASRNPAFYERFGVPDTLEGRFELLILHAALALRRLAALPAPGPDMAQDLSNAVFRHFDAALREMGVGDLTVPKRIKTMAEAFLGRAQVYDAALRQDNDQQLGAALTRNVYGRPAVAVAGGAAKGDVWSLTRYARASAAGLAAADAKTLLSGAIAFPDPVGFAAQGPKP